MRIDKHSTLNKLIDNRILNRFCYFKFNVIDTYFLNKFSNRLISSKNYENIK
jgi:hypothetical protein